jgi:hypothetical protein
MRLIAITTCTDRKKFPVSPELSASGLTYGRQSRVASVWRKRVKSTHTVGLARDVYCGRNFQEAKFAARAGGADFWIISGGLGLVRQDQLIPPYSLSLVRQSSEFIGSRIIDEPFDAARWWGEIQGTSEPAPLATMVRASPSATVVIGITSSYLPLVGDDLLSLNEDELGRLRLIGLGIGDACPAALWRSILPYDDRLDGPDSPIRGTRGDFSSRAMRHFIEHVLPEHRAGSIEAHQAAVDRRLKSWRHPKPISRPSRTDEEIIQLIKRNWRAIEGKSSLGLRYLRDVEKIACEQGRYRSLFHRAAKQVTS